MCTKKPLPLANVVLEPPQFRTWLPALPEIEQRPAFDWLSIDQITPVPEPAGRGSLTVTPVAVVVPVLLTETVNPIGSPAFTDDASATLLIVIGH